jgi:hypothetical protein
MIGELYRLTSDGRKYAGSISPSRRDDILDHLYRQKTGSTLDELSAVTGKTHGVLRALLSRYRAKGYVRVASGGMGG